LALLPFLVKADELFDIGMFAVALLFAVPVDAAV